MAKAMTSADPEQIVHEIRTIQQELVELQHKVIQGQVTPQDYLEKERENVARIHRLEEQLAHATGQPEPDRDTAPA